MQNSEVDIVIDETVLMLLMLISAVFLGLLLFKLGFESTEIIFFEIGLNWNFFCYSQKAQQDSLTKRYKYSFLRFSFGINNFLNELINKNNLFLIELIVKIIAPAIFTGALLFLFNATQSDNGMMLFKLIHVIWGAVFAQTIIGIYLIGMSLIKLK